MSVFGLGLNNHYQSGPSSNDSVSFSDVMGSPSAYPIDSNELLFISCGMYHTLFLLKGGRVLVCGSDLHYRIGRPQGGEYSKPIEFEFDEPIKWLTCGARYSCYLTKSGKLIYSCEESNGPYNIQYNVPIIYLSSSTDTPLAIDEVGDVLIFSKDPKTLPRKFSFPAPAFEVAGGINFVYVITTDYQVYFKHSKDESPFEKCEDFDGIKIISIVGYLEHYLALSDDGKVYAKGKNSHYQIGNGSNEEVDHFTQVKGELEYQKVKKIAVGGWHSLCLTEDSKLYGFGLNTSYQMSKLTNDEGQLYKDIPYPKLITCFNGNEVSDFALGSEFSFYLTGEIEFPHPAKEKFLPIQPNKAQLVKNLYTFLNFPDEDEDENDEA